MMEEPECCKAASFETQVDIRARMNEWAKITGAKVISVETIPMRIFCGGEEANGFDTMYTWNTTRTSKQLITTSKWINATLLNTLQVVIIRGK